MLLFRGTFSCRPINDKNLNSEIETYKPRADGLLMMAINDKNLNSEIETKKPGLSAVPNCAINDKNLNSEIETIRFQTIYPLTRAYQR